MSGVIDGGWGFVWAAYALTGAVLTIYMFSVIGRFRSERKRAESNERNLSEVI